MSFWKYGIIGKKLPFSDESYYAVHEIYFGDNSKIYAYTEQPLTIIGDSKEEILAELTMIIKDIKDSKMYDETSLNKQIKEYNENE